MTEQNGALAGLRVIELASDHAAFAGKLLADLGAEVIVVEPPGGHRSRTYEPFLNDAPGPDRSLWWWHYNTSKLSVVLDLEVADDALTFRRLVETADIVLEGETPGRLASLGLDAHDLRASLPTLIWVSVTAFGRESTRRDEQFTDLTVLAGGGPVWSCGYDDHTIPPVRGGGNQGYQIGSVWAAIGALIAVLVRDMTERGQLVDVSLHAASNVTTEMGTHMYLVAGSSVERRTCRHATPPDMPTQSTLAQTADGKYANTGISARFPRHFRGLVEWIDELELRDEFEPMPFLEMGADRSIDLADIGVDPLVTEIMSAGRDAIMFVAAHTDAVEFFHGSQGRDLACGPIYSPEEMLDDEHFVARGFPVTVRHEDLERDFIYPGAPFKMYASPWRISRRAPHVGEHTELVVGPLR